MNWKQGNLVPKSLIGEFQAEAEIWLSKKIQFFGLARLWTNDVNVVSCARYGVCNSFFAKLSLQFCSNKYFK